MPGIGSITNPSQLLQEKVNYFSDYFHYYVEESGRKNEFEIENPLSLIEKIIYQIENNAHRRSIHYITHYLGHSHLQRNDFIAEFKEFNEFEKHNIELHRVGDKQQLKWLEENKDFFNNLTRFKTELEKDMFKSSLQNIISYISCEHELEKHKSDIEFHSKIIASEFFFKGRTKKDINQIFNQILSRNPYRFPFPKDVKTQKDKQIRLKNRNLQEQFFGIFNLIEREKKLYTYIFKIHGIGFEGVPKLKYNKVSLYSKNHKKFDEIKKDMDVKYGDKSYFFSGDEYVLCLVPVTFYTHEAAKQQAIAIIKSELSYLNVIFKRNFSVDTSCFLVTSNFKTVTSSFSHDPLFININKSEEKDFNDNPYFILRNIKNEAKRHLLNHEHLFIKAISTNNISDYWHYLETLLLAENKSKLVEDTASSLVLLNEQELKKWYIRLKIYNLTNRHNCSADIIGLTLFEQKSTQADFEKGVLSKLYSKVKYPFIQKLVKEYEKKVSSVEFLTQKAYYTSILLESYEQRNFFMHQGIQNETAIIKLNHSLPQIVKRLRWVLLKEVKKHKQITFLELTNLLLEKANVLCEK